MNILFDIKRQIVRPARQTMLSEKHILRRLQCVSYAWVLRATANYERRMPLQSVHDARTLV